MFYIAVIDLRRRLAVKVDGKWLMLVEDEPFDRESNRLLTLSGEASDGERFIFDINDDERLVLTKIDERGRIEGKIYQGGTMPEGDPGDLFKERNESEDYDDPRYDDLPIANPVRLYRENIIHQVFGPSSGKSR